ncbi:M20/M25/M40 family metallo-hydrolase [Candidatus Poribacteria bacterium]|nr:M20/M25/M40 family metallo-hydrolase [Candidatus Poribacteria bacterium]
MRSKTTTFLLLNIFVVYFTILALLPSLSLCATGPDLVSEKNQIIQGLLEEADGQRWLQIIKAVSENEDWDNPGHLFHSRYALRVREAKVFDGKPSPDDACDNAAEYIAEIFKSYGLEVEFDSFEHNRWSLEGGKQGDYVMRNVVATLPGKGPNRKRAYLMTAHYDSIASKTTDWEKNWRVLPAPGADDNASGMAEMLETARILTQSEVEFDFTIKFIAFGGEELGLFGSKYYAQHAKEIGEQIAGVLNFDQLGHDNDDILDIHVVGNDHSEWLVNAFQTASQIYNIDIDFRKVIDPKFVYSDHAPFWEKGYSAVMVSEESSMDSPDWPQFTHSDQDTLDKINLRLGERAIQLAVATLAELADPIISLEADDLNPDIIVEPNSFILSNYQVSKGDTVNLSAAIRNLSSIPLNDIEFWFTIVTPEGKVRILEQKLNLNVNESQTVNNYFRVDDWGVYTLRAIVNPNVTIFEPNFENNVLQQTLKASISPLQLSNVLARPNYFKLNQKGSNLRVSYQLSADAKVSVEIYTLFGLLIYREEYAIGSTGGKLGVNDNFTWDGRNKQGEMVASGVYFCNVTATDGEGNISREAKKIIVR